MFNEIDLIREIYNLKGYITRRDILQVLRSTEEEAQEVMSYLVRIKMIKRINGYSMPFRFEFIDKKETKKIARGVLEYAEA